jgi:hypothetical protein
LETACTRTREVSHLAADKSSPEIVTEPLPDLMLWLDPVFQIDERNFERHRLAATILGSLAGVIAGFVLLGT